MRVSVSLPDEDVEFLDAYARQRGLASRSVALHRAVRLLRGQELDAAYEDAFGHWTDAGEEKGWESTTADGVTGDARR